jgi:hypothetical protein
MRRIDRGRPTQELTSHAWDAVTRGSPVAIDTLDPALLETMRRLKVLDEQQRADADFAERLEAELLHELSTPSFPDVTPTRSLTSVLNESRASQIPQAPPPWQDASRLHRSWSAPLATAALVVLTLIGSLAAFGGPLRDKHVDEEPASILALGGTLETRLPQGVTAEAVLLQGTFDVIPPTAVWIDVERTVLDPGATWSRGENQNNGEGPELYRVESGALTIETDGPITVTRSGSQTPTRVDAGTDVVLNVGDMGFTPSGVTSRWRNGGATSTSIMHAGISTSELGTFPRGVHREQLIIDKWATNPLAAPAVMTVRNLTIDAGASLSPQQVSGLQGLYVETGSLEVLVSGGQGTSVASLILPERSTRTVGGRGHKIFPANWTLRNAGDAPVTLLIITVTPANPLAAAPMQ